MGIKENFNISIFDDISNKKSGAKHYEDKKNSSNITSAESSSGNKKNSINNKDN